MVLPILLRLSPPHQRELVFPCVYSDGPAVMLIPNSYEFERKREHVVSAVECVMNQYGISAEESHKLLNKEIENAWKDINEECLKPNRLPTPVLHSIVNFSLVIELLHVDFQGRFTEAEQLKDHVAALFLDPIQIEQYDSKLAFFSHG
ncbi:hypothetical protein L6164_028846 [Bauhinia variegata]|uniref:Uncharacterized protein n=1 Tax=Bauhinia variegata TaxID=167791 RepID=A0ACB9L7T0_BAUVA|nr:hypothetical protein L6164_028846 [Bauhinia variegata]